jgi:hypothetical protein
MLSDDDDGPFPPMRGVITVAIDAAADFRRQLINSLVKTLSISLSNRRRDS